MSVTVDTALPQRLVDHNEITELVYRLGMCLDEGRFDRMRSLLVEEATARTPGGTANGREAVIAQARRNHRPDQLIQHIITNVLVELNGDQAKVRANLVVHFASAADARVATPAPPIRFSLGEVYHFDAQRTAHGWRLSRVETSPIWMSGTPGPPPA